MLSKMRVDSEFLSEAIANDFGVLHLARKF